MNLTVTITCPTCFEQFDVPAPHPSEVPSTMDYDCEICCRPMTIHFWLDEVSGDVDAEAQGLGD